MGLRFVLDVFIYKTEQVGFTFSKMTMTGHEFGNKVISFFLYKSALHREFYSNVRNLIWADVPSHSLRIRQRFFL